MRRLLPVVVLGVALSACGHSKPTGPSWPAASKTADDGGESIAPHESSTVAAAIEKADEPEAKKDDAPVVTPAAASEDKAPAVTAPTQPANDDIIMSDEIIIEIDD